MRSTLSIRRTILSVALLAGTAGPLAASQGDACTQRDTPNEIYPDDPRWSSADGNLQGAGSAGITTTNPRSGEGSLELSTTGSIFDWAFFKRVAEGNGAWGLLSQINCVSMDWYRNPYTLAEDAPWYLEAETWKEQTPVLRLLVRDPNAEAEYSQLVWEGWYNSRGVLQPTINGLWNFEDMTGQQFWRHFDGGTTYTNAGCADQTFSASSDLQTFSLGNWGAQCYSSSAEVYGVMIGLGSYWPGEYSGFVDNVQLSFAGQPGFAVEDNFEFEGVLEGAPTTTTPEPASMVLMATGLLVLGGVNALRRRKAAASVS